MLKAENYWQAINLAFNKPLAVSPVNAICVKLSSGPSPTEVQLAAQYSQSGDNVNIIAYLQRIPGRPIKAGACTFSVSEMTGNGLWNPVSTGSFIASEDSLNRWTVIIPASTVISNLCMGKSTLKIIASLMRQSKTYTKEIYVNHLGVADAMAYFRNKIQVLETSKKDE